MYTSDRPQDQSARTQVPRVVSWLDWITVVALAVAAATFIWGGFREQIFGVRVSVRSWERLTLAAMLLTAARHAYLRSPSAPQHLYSQIRSFWRTPERAAVWPAFVATRLGVLFVGYLAVVTIGMEGLDRGRVSDDELENLPARWDAGWYMSIVTEGYDWTGNEKRQQNVVFFPAFPMAIRAVGLFFGRQWLQTGLVLALVAFFCALLYFFRLARELLGDEQSRIAVWALAAYPFSVYYSAPYTESFFLLGSVATFYHALHNQWWRAALWGFFVGLCRPNGFLIALPVTLFIVNQMIQRRRVHASAWVAVLTPIAGVLAYSLFLYARFGDALAWRKGQFAWGRAYLGLWPSVRSLWVDRYQMIANGGLYDYSVTDPYDLLHTSAAIFILVSVWPTIRRFGIAYGAFTIVNIVPPLMVGGMLSIGRMTSVLFPAFLWLGAMLPAKQPEAWIAAFCVLQGLMAVLFFTWRPLF